MLPPLKVYPFLFKGLHTLPGEGFCQNYIVLFLLKGGVFSKRKEFAPNGSKFFPFRVDPFTKMAWYAAGKHRKSLKFSLMLKMAENLPSVYIVRKMKWTKSCIRWVHPHGMTMLLNYTSDEWYQNKQCSFVIILCTPALKKSLGYYIYPKYSDRNAVGLGGSVGCTSDWWSGGCWFDPCRVGNILSWRFGHEIFSVVILFLPLVLKGLNKMYKYWLTA